MSRLIFVLGSPGTGKTSSLTNLKKDEVAYITVTGKELPFKTDIQPVVAKTAKEVTACVQKSKKPIVVIDDINYIFTHEVFTRANETNQYDVYKDIGNSFYNLIETIISKPTDQNIYLFGHLELNDNKLIQLKTAGKVIRDKIAPEGLSNIVFESVNDLGEFVFRVRSDGSGVKSPLQMFETDTIPNDLKIINTTINKYYQGGK